MSLYLDAVHDRVHRQVQIDARVIEVELNDPDSQSLDWALVAQGSAQTAGVPGASRPAINGLRVSDVSRFMTALAAQGASRFLRTPEFSCSTMNRPWSVPAPAGQARLDKADPANRT